MIWGQMSVCFLLWIAYGVFMRTRVQRMAQAWRKMPAGRRTVVAGSMLIGGIAVLFVGLTSVAALGWLTPNGLTVAGLIVVLLCGLAFTDLQVRAALGLAVATMTPRSETPPPAQTSKDSEE